MNLMLLGNSCSGKTTLMKILTKYGYHKMPTGDITRFLYECGCQNMPVIVQTLIENLRPDNYCFDHFYIHTMEQLHDVTGHWPIVVNVIDKRTGNTHHSQDPAKIERKQERFNSQLPQIFEWLAKHKAVQVVTVYNTDYGFDMSELIEYKIVPYDTFAMVRP